jgi:hypothetical protein
LRLQAKARGDALKLLGLPRIPLWPSREFTAIDEKLKQPIDEGVREKAIALRKEAQRLWQTQEYSKANAALSEALRLQNIKLLYLRCGSL